MPRKPKAEPIIPNDDDMIETDIVGAAEDFELEKFLEEHSGSIARVVISRVGAKGILEQVDVVGTDGLTPETLRENYGAPATYVLRFRGSDGRFRAERRIVLGPVKLNSGGVGVSGSNATADLLKIQIDMMAARSAEQAAMINTLLAGIVNRPQGPTTDPATLLTALVGAFSTLQSAVVKTAPEDPIEKFKSMFSLVKELLPAGPVAAETLEDNPWSVVKEIGARAVDMARPFIERAAAGAIPAMQTTHGGSTTSAALLPAQTEGGQPVKTPLQWVREGLDYLKDKAKANKDPEMFIEYILENGEEMRFAAIIGAVKQGVTFEQLLQFDAEIAQNPTLTEWFKNVYDGIFAELFPSGDAAVDTGGPGGNARDVAGNGKAGAAGPGESSAPVVSKSD